MSLRSTREELQALPSCGVTNLYVSLLILHPVTGVSLVPPALYEQQQKTKVLVFLTWKESERVKRGSQSDKISNFFSLLMWWWWLRWWWSFFSPRHNFFFFFFFLKQLHLHESRRSHYSRESSSFVSVVRLREVMLSVFVQSVTRWWSAALSVPAVSCHHVRTSSSRVALRLSPCLHTTTPPTFFFFFFRGDP